MKINYKTTIVQIGNNTGIHVPDDGLEKLNAGKKPLVKITLNGYTYRSAVGKMEGKFMIPLSAENRKNAKVQGAQTLEVSIEVDQEPRTVELPAVLALALKKDKKAAAAFELLAPSRKKAIVVSINDAKTEETRDKRIAKAIEGLLG